MIRPRYRSIKMGKVFAGGGNDAFSLPDTDEEPRLLSADELREMMPKSCPAQLMTPQQLRSAAARSAAHGLREGRLTKQQAGAMCDACERNHCHACPVETCTIEGERRTRGARR